jgi:hypothetical protein
VEHWASPAALAAHERNEAFIHFGQEVLVRHATLHALYCPFRAQTPICRKNSLGSMIRPNGRNCYRRWPMGRRRPKGI